MGRLLTLAMTTKRKLAHCAGSAIAAALVLASTPLIAQQADPSAAPPPAMPVVPTEPVLQVPVSPAPAPSTVQIPVDPAPAVVIPDTAPSTAPEPGAIESEAVNVPPPATTTATTATERAAPTRTAAPAATTATDIEPPATPDEGVPQGALDETAETTILPAPLAAPVDGALDEATDEPAATSDLTNTILAGLAALGLALLAFLLLRRRKPKRLAAPRREAVAAPKSPPAKLADTPRVLEPAPAERGLVNSSLVAASAPESDLGDSTPVPLASARPAAAGGLANAGAAVRLPREAPTDYAERAALVDRLANAKPDRANPFRSLKARRHRARLIVQSLGHHFPNGSLIDLSQYPENWPELARRDLSTAA